MKKALRKIFTYLSIAMTFLIVSVASISINAYFTPSFIQYDIDDEAYIAKVNSLGKHIALEEEFLKTSLAYRTTELSELKHVYFRSEKEEISDNYTLDCTFEYNNGKEIFFYDGYLCFLEPYVYSTHDDSQFFEEYSLDEINKTLNEKNLKVQCDKVDDIYGGKIDRIKLIYDEDVTEEDVIRASIELYKMYNMKIFGAHLCSAPDTFTYEPTTPSTTLGTPTIAGDLDLNDSVGASDIVMMSKFLASAQVYPIDDPTALANADVNQDGEINSDDTATMIEMYLGAYEMV